ncbi:MAG: winged helix-turn-helix transcriptional regulator [Candidatus Thermoplasmatota archaeon]|nr:winged helix-turn-helix transcriptional regulator [Candidatus Thermoplasmatota archaeon]MBU1941630.1 winged helix-turn-helix transcriptional regulator [Candidatus Thermoplasmatota archaeon]
MDDILELETRRKIYDSVQKNPGIHLSKVATLLGMRVSLVEYHLRYLEKHHIVRSDKNTGYKRYFISSDSIPVHTQNFSILRQKTVLIIVLYLLKMGGAHHKEILDLVQVGPATLSYHLNRLVKHKILVIESQGTQRLYQVKESEELVRWLVKYRPYDLFDGFTDVWKDLTLY